MSNLSYIVEKEEVYLVSKWSSKILGCDFQVNCAMGRVLKQKTVSIVEAARGGAISMEEFNRLLQDKVLEIELEYPDCFSIKEAKRLGWYELQTLADYYKQGRVSIDGWSFEQALQEKQELQRQVRARLEVEAQLQRLELEEKVRLAEEARLPVVVGMTFRSKNAVLKAYREEINKALEGEKKTMVAKEQLLATFVSIKWETTCWRVLEVYKEGGRAWLENSL